MALTSRRIFFECTKIFTLSISILLLFILMGRAVQLRDMLLGLELGFLDILILFGFLSPYFFTMMAPVATMLAVFLTFLRMGTDRELIALHAGGVSLYKLLPAPLLFGALCTAITLWVTLVFVAWGMGNFRSFILDMAQSKVSIALQPGTFNRDIPNMVFYARQVDLTNGNLGAVMVEDSTRKGMPLTILAPRGNLDTDFDRGDVLILLQDGSIYSVADGQITKLSFEEYAVRFSINTLFQGLDLGPVKPKEMKWSDLTAFNFDELYKTSPQLANKIMVEQHKRWLFPLSCLVLTICAIPIATAYQGVQKQTGLMIALIFFLVYYTVVFAGISLGESAGTNPFLVIWLPAGFFLLLGAYGTHLSAQEKMPLLAVKFRRLIRIGKRKLKTIRQAKS